TNFCRLVLAAAALCCSCVPTTDVGSKYVVDQNVGTSGDTLTVSSSASPDLAGTKLEIPAGALSADTRITLELGTTDLVGGNTKKGGAVAIWKPSGTKFTKPVTMTLPYVLQAGESPDRLVV